PKISTRSPWLFADHRLRAYPDSCDPKNSAPVPVPVWLRPPLVGRGARAVGGPPFLLVDDPPAASLPRVRGPFPLCLRVRRALAGRRLGRSAPYGRRRLDAPRPLLDRPDRPVVPALEPGGGTAALAGDRPARLAVLTIHLTGNGDRE